MLISSMGWWRCWDCAWGQWLPIGTEELSARGYTPWES